MTTVAVDAWCLAGTAAQRGVGTYFRGVLGELAKDPTIDIVALAPAGVTLPSNVRVRRIRRWAPPRWALHEHETRLPWEMRRVPADVYWAPTPDAPRSNPGPSIQLLHDVIPLTSDDPGLAEERHRFVRYAPRYRAADAVIAVSRFAADEGIVHLGLDPTRVHVSHLAAGPQFQPREEGPDDPPYLVLVSEWEERKGYREAFAAIGALAEAGHPHRLRVAGFMAPWKSAQLEAVCAAAPRRDRIDLLGQVDHKSELPGLLQGATAFVGASRAEGFGLPALEAMACGTPVVAFSNTSTTEVVADGGVLVADGDIDALVAALTRVITEPGWAAELRERGLRRAASFSWAKSAAIHAEIMHSVSRRG